MATFQHVFKNHEEKKAEARQMRLQNIHYTKLVSSQYQYRGIVQDAVLQLAELIEMDDEVLQPLVVRKAGADTYEILAGHKRYMACKYLVEERKKEKFAMLPCYIRNKTDVRSEFSVYSTNGYGLKTQYEQMREIEGMLRLLKEHPEEFPDSGGGRLVERLSKLINVSRSVISDFHNISHNLGETGMKAFEEGKIDKSAAVTLAALPEQKQEEVLDQGLTTRKAIKTYIKAETEENKNMAPEEEETGSVKEPENPVPIVGTDEPGEDVKTGSQEQAEVPSGAERPMKEDTDRKADLEWYVQTYFEKNEQEKERCITIYYNHFTTEQRAKAIQKYLAPLGFSGGSGEKISYDFKGYHNGITFSAPDKEPVKLSYLQLVRTMEEIYLLREGRVLNEMRIEPGKSDSMLKKITISGMCPYCRETLYYPLHMSYCGHCGKEISWNPFEKS